MCAFTLSLPLSPSTDNNSNNNNSNNTNQTPLLSLQLESYCYNMFFSFPGCDI